MILPLPGHAEGSGRSSSTLTTFLTLFMASAWIQNTWTGIRKTVQHVDNWSFLPSRKTPHQANAVNYRGMKYRQQRLGGLQTMCPQALDDNDFPGIIHTLRHAMYGFLQVRLCSTTESFLAQSYRKVLQQNSLILGLYTFEVEASVPISAPQSRRILT